MAANFDAHTRYRLGDEVHFVMSPNTEESVGRVVAIHMTTDLRVSYALAPPDRKPSDPRRNLTRVPEQNIKGLTANTPWLTRVRRRCHSIR
ncbi:hypothetical protein DAEQUDRAFT_733502 [Daedalea quercina L-15889]|uniref:Hypervirulence associated protein TUDOR domain-containing protein n=1 Tax=Daedalea quercina L-15889 TaxID=1314783 RepID=A0A165KXX1_9APHY|nr:hypothetical protein DAEQUDRAFT_733502 [Daedalea quercina L-15889]